MRIKPAPINRIDPGSGEPMAAGSLKGSNVNKLCPVRFSRYSYGIVKLESERLAEVDGTVGSGLVVTGCSDVRTLGSVTRRDEAKL